MHTMKSGNESITMDEHQLSIKSEYLGLVNDWFLKNLSYEGASQ